MALGTLAIWLLGAALAGPNVAVIESDDLEPYTAPVSSLLATLDQPALVVNIHGRRADADEAMARVKREDPDVIVALGAKAAFAAKKKMPSTPLIYVSVLEPERYGIPGSQSTGIHMRIDPLDYLSQFTGFFPEVQRVGVLKGPSVSAERMAEIQAAAAELGMEVVVADVARPRDVRTTFHDMAGDIDALWLMPDREILTRESFRFLSDDTRRRRIPLLVETDNMVRAGGLFAMVPDYEELGVQAGEMALQVLAGKAPSLIPEEAPRSMLVVLNVKTVRSANIEFEELLLDFVDVVIQ